MKSFTAKEFSRCPAKVYEAAREDGKVEVTHDRFRGKFVITYEIGWLSSMNEKLYDFDRAAIACATQNIVDNGDGTISFRRPAPYKKAPD